MKNIGSPFHDNRMTPQLYNLQNVFADICPEWWETRRECIQLDDKHLNVMLLNGCVCHFTLIRYFNIRDYSYELWFEPLRRIS